MYLQVLFVVLLMNPLFCTFLITILQVFFLIERFLAYGIYRSFSIKSYRALYYKEIASKEFNNECLPHKQDYRMSNSYSNSESKNKSKVFTPLLKQANFKHQLNKSFLRKGFKSDVINFLSCTTCPVAFVFVQNIQNQPFLMDLAWESLIKLCSTMISYNPKVCSGYFGLIKEVAYYIIDKRKGISASFICGILLMKNGCSLNEIKYPEWKVEIQPKTRTWNQEVHLKSEAKPLKIIHITDPHIDPLYKPQGNADCDYPICARQNQGNPAPGSIPAGQWGDYRNSDIPWATFEALLSYLKNEHKDIDFVYFTGDIIPHNIWETSQKEVKEVMTTFFNKMKENFGNIPVFPVLGNHDIHPLTLFSPFYVKANEIITSQWVYDLIAKIWSPWLPKSTIATIQKGGYYTVVVKPGFRIIGLNNNPCLSYNLWIFYDDETLLKPQLQWLADTLQEAEKNGEFVHILTHVPPGSRDCFASWSREFQRIILRYSDIIKGQFNGHTHKEEIRLFTQPQSKIVKNVAFNGGSLTTFSDLNPNFRIYFADSNTYDILDFTTWIYNITEANKYPDKSPKWFELYSFKTEFNIKSLKPSDMEIFFQVLEKNDNLLKKYREYLYSSSSSENVKKFINDEENNALCDIISTEYFPNSQCNERSFGFHHSAV